MGGGASREAGGATYHLDAPGWAASSADLDFLGMSILSPGADLGHLAGGLHAPILF